jgi:hypothetical protein
VKDAHCSAKRWQEFIEYEWSDVTPKIYRLSGVVVRVVVVIITLLFLGLLPILCFFVILPFIVVVAVTVIVAIVAVSISVLHCYPRSLVQFHTSHQLRPIQESLQIFV